MTISNYIFLFLAFSISQEQEYIISKDPDFDSLYKTHRRSSIELTNSNTVFIDELCGSEMNKNFKFEENFSHLFSDQEIALMTEYRVNINIVINSLGGVEQTDFTTTQNPCKILSLIGKIDSIYSEQGKVSTNLCSVPDGKFARLHFMLRTRRE